MRVFCVFLNATSRYHRANVVADKPGKIFADETNEPFVEMSAAKGTRLRHCCPEERLSCLIRSLCKVYEVSSVNVATM